jgi:hypothetical protein
MIDWNVPLKPRFVGLSEAQGKGAQYKEIFLPGSPARRAGAVRGELHSLAFSAFLCRLSLTPHIYSSTFISQRDRLSFNKGAIYGGDQEDHKKMTFLFDIVITL